MNDLTPENREPIRELPTDDVNLHAELHELRQRLTALEASVPQGQQTDRKPRRRMILTLLVVALTLVVATMVFGQAAVDSLFISKDGKVGIGTSAPVSRLHIHGDYQNTGAGGLALDASDSNNPEQYVLRINPFALGNSMVGYQFQTKSTVGGTQTPLTFDNQGRVGIGATPTNKLSVAGNADISGNLSLGTLNATNALRADAQSFLFANGSADSTNNVVLRKDGSNAYIFPWGTGTSSNTVIVGGGNRTNFGVSGDMNVTGNLNSTGRYQRDDNSEATYPVTPRYHVSLSAAAYAGRTRQIPQQVIIDLCGDQDGCEFRLGMTKWDNDNSTQTASRTGLLYYSTSNGRWRTANSDTEAVDGNNATNHVMGIWDTCYFTDGPYSGSREQGDSAIGMYLLSWTGGFGNAGRTCELTLID